jgi:hypothetical protein
VTTHLHKPAWSRVAEKWRPFAAGEDKPQNYPVARGKLWRTGVCVEAWPIPFLSDRPSGVLRTPPMARSV